MRLAAQAKCGFYPTPEAVIKIISRYLKRKREGIIRILDPCAGEGIAVKEIAERLNAESYGIEIDIERGARAKNILTNCLVTDYENTRISRNAFSLLSLNPPYDFAVRDDELETSERYERTFLRNTIPYLCKRGILVYLIPQKRLDGRIANILCYRFEDIKVYRFPEDEYKAFKQIVIFGKLKTEANKDEKTAVFLKNIGQHKAVVPFISEEPQIYYEVPLSPQKINLIFRSKDIDSEELSKEIEESVLFKQLKELTTPLRITEKIRPIMPLRHGHLAQILACGMMNGIVWDRDMKNPLLIKGITKKEVKHKVEVDGDVEKHIETDHIKIIINAFNSDGEILKIQ